MLKFRSTLWTQITFSHRQHLKLFFSPLPYIRAREKEKEACLPSNNVEQFIMNSKYEFKSTGGKEDDPENEVLGLTEIFTVVGKEELKRGLCFSSKWCFPCLPSSFIAPLVRTEINSDTNRLSPVLPPFDLSMASVSFLNKSVFVCLAFRVIISSSAEHKEDSLHTESRVQGCCFVTTQAADVLKTFFFHEDQQ